MKCIQCKKRKTSHPKGICGVCVLTGVLLVYGYHEKAKEFCKNMPIGSYEQSKTEFFDAHSSPTANAE